MSSFASFFRVSALKSADLLTAAKPQKQQIIRRGFLFKKRETVLVSGLGKYLATESLDRCDFEAGGDIFAYIALFLEEIGSPIEDFEAAPISAQLTTNQDALTLVFDADGANAAARAVETETADSARIASFLRETLPVDQQDKAISTFLAASTFLVSQLRRIDRDELGILRLT